MIREGQLGNPLSSFSIRAWFLFFLVWWMMVLWLSVCPYVPTEHILAPVVSLLPNLIDIFLS